MLSFLLAAALLPGQTGEVPAALVVYLPSEARLYVDDSRTRSTGSQRRLETPALSVGRTYYYTLRAEFERDGRLVREEKRVSVRAGQETAVAFFQTVRAAPPDEPTSGGAGGFAPGTAMNPGGIVSGMGVNPGVPNGMNLGGGNAAFPATPGGGKIVQKMVNQNGVLVQQTWLYRPNGSQVLISQGAPRPYSGSGSMGSMRPAPYGGGMRPAPYGGGMRPGRRP